MNTNPEAADQYRSAELFSLENSFSLGGLGTLASFEAHNGILTLLLQGNQNRLKLKPLTPSL